VSDPSPRGETIATRCGVPNRPDYRDLLSDGPNGVIISVPNALHREVGSFFALAGVDLLVEKPLAESVEAGRDIVAAARHGGAHLLVGHHRRHSNLVAEARKLVAERLGHLLATNTLVTMRKPDNYYAADWRRRPDAGPLLVNVIHEIDLLRAICGEISAVHAMGSDRARGFEFDDTLAIVLRYACGAVGTMTVSESTPAPWSWETSVSGGLGFSTYDQDYMVFAGTEGSLTFPGLHLWHYQDETEPGWSSPLTTTSHEVEPNDPYRDQVENFVEVIRGLATPVVEGGDALMSLAVIEAIAESSATGSVVSLGK
jgi:predicted dehydrogenase